jgi:hypothetical protein
MWDFWWTKWHWGMFSPEYFVFPCQFHSTVAPLHGKTKTLIIFITGLHNKPQGCGASVASAAGPSPQKKKKVNIFVGDNIGHCERKFDTNACLTVSRYRRRIV